MSVASKSRQSAFDKNHEVILRNLSVTDDLVKRLRDVDLISDSMVIDIQEVPNQSNNERVQLLITFLSLKVAYSGNFDLFCDALEFCGHQILATFLRGEVIDTTAELRNQNSDSKMTNPKSPHGKSETINAYAKAVAEINTHSGFLKAEETDLVGLVRHLKQENSDKNDQITRLEENLLEEVAKSRDLHASNQVMRTEIAYSREKAEAYQVQQNKYAEARENQIKRLEERALQLNSKIEEINAKFPTPTVLPVKKKTKKGTMIEEEGSDTGVLYLAWQVDEALARLRDFEKRSQEFKQAVDHERTAVLSLLDKRFSGETLEQAMQGYITKVGAEKKDYERKTKLLLDCLTEDSEAPINLTPSPNESWTIILKELADLKHRTEEREIQLTTLRKQLDVALKEQSKLRFQHSVLAPKKSLDHLRHGSNLAGSGPANTSTTTVAISPHSITIGPKTGLSNVQIGNSVGTRQIPGAVAQRYGSLQPIRALGQTQSMKRLNGGQLQQVSRSGPELRVHDYQRRGEKVSITLH